MAEELEVEAVSEFLKHLCALYMAENDPQPDHNDINQQLRALSDRLDNLTIANQRLENTVTTLRDRIQELETQQNEFEPGDRIRITNATNPREQTGTVLIYNSVHQRIRFRFDITQ